MSVRKCQHDQLQAKHVCTTHNAFLCETHFNEHVSDRQTHMIFEFDNALVESDFKKLQNQINQRINTLEKAKHKVTNRAAQLIEEIRQACVSGIQDLNNQIKAYREYTINNSFDDLTFQNVRKILTTLLKIEIQQQLSLNIREEPIRDQE
jgi:hypothetical protein